jgi:hypothetical protein
MLSGQEFVELVDMCDCVDILQEFVELAAKQVFGRIINEFFDSSPNDESQTSPYTSFLQVILLRCFAAVSFLSI